MIDTDDQFVDIIDNKKFVDDMQVQEDIFFYVMKNPTATDLQILWLLQESYDLIFTHVILEALILEVCNIDEILECLRLFVYKPTSFFERVLDSGNTQQIETLKLIFTEVFDEQSS